MAVKAAASWSRVRAALSVSRYVRHSCSTAGEGDNPRGTKPGALDFGDTREAYRSRSFSELFRHYVVFKAFTFEYLVDHNKGVS